MSWKLICDRGRQIWKYFDNVPSVEEEFDRTNRSCSDKIYRNEAFQRNSSKFQFNLDNLGNEFSKTMLNNDFYRSLVEQTLKGINYYMSLQDDDGHWPADYGGPLFLVAGAILSFYITKFELADEEKYQFIRYLFNHQSIDDGGWGTHIEGQSTMFGTVLIYVSLRILGVESNDNRMIKGRLFINDHGGPHYSPSWAKFWLCLMNLIPWNGINSISPELWMFPSWFEFHPSKLWCHSRMVYLSMSFIYSNKISVDLNPFIEQLREELYQGNYLSINFIEHRDSVASIDLYVPQTRPLKLINKLFNFYESIHLESFRQRSSNYLFELIEGEDRHTNYINIGPVNKFLNMISVFYVRGEKSEQYKKHCSRVRDYFWISEDGMKIQGYNGSQLWDTVFSLQSIIETGMDFLYENEINLAYRYIDISQVKENIENSQYYYRHRSKGAWPFSTVDHGWPITDCTAEALKTVLLLNKKSYLNIEKIDNKRLEDSIDFLLESQNKDGGWSSYELKRSSNFFEWFNPSEVFSRIMIDYSYVECTSACLQSLHEFLSFSSYRNNQIKQSIKRAQQFIVNEQRSDGSWIGSWAICFTYGSWFAIDGLIRTGFSHQSQTIKKSVEFLLSKQNIDGGWGESILSSIKQTYIQHQQSQLVNSSWAVLALISARADRSSIERAIQFILSKQLSNGDWIQQSTNGIFNGNCSISYTNYRNIFPIWALGRFIQYSKEYF